MSGSDPRPVVEVAAALIRDGAGRYLIARRPPGTHLAGLWEFPGGKREAGESLEMCLVRELAEELSVTAVVEAHETTVRWTCPDRTLLLHFFRCRLLPGPVVPREAQAVAWVLPARLHEYAFPPADATLVARLRAEAPPPRAS